MESSPRWWIGPVHVAGYLLATVFWLVALGIGAAVYFVWSGLPMPLLGADGGFGGPTVMRVLQWFTIIQLVGMAAIAVVGALLVPPIGGSWRRVGPVLGFTRTSAGALALALALGLVVGWFPSWLAEVLKAWIPVPMINQLLGDAFDGTVGGVALAVLMVAVSAPVCEELVFRGYLWTAIERSGAPPVATWLVTSLLFTAYHLDPSQMFGVLPIALALGWTRWRTRSVWPGMALHFANNALALAASAVDSDWAPPAWLAVTLLLATFGLCAALWRISPRDR